MADFMVLSFDLLSWYLSLICSPAHIDSDKNFIFCVNIYIYSQYMLITFLVILTCSFEMAAILVLFYICSPAHIHNNGNFIFGVKIQI